MSTKIPAVSKILADGTRLPVTDPTTAHVAIEFEDGVMATAHTLFAGVEEGGTTALPFATQQEAEKAAGLLPLLGFENWKLGTDRDYEDYVLDRTQYPAHDKNLYPALILTDWYCTRTEFAHPDWRDAAGVASRAWCVYLDSGSVSSSNRSGSGFALAFRRPGQ